MPRAPSKNTNNASRPSRVHKAPVIFNVPVELPSKEKKEPQFLTQRQNVNGLKTKPTYAAMIAKALYECRDPFHGMKFNDICKYIETNYPVKPEYRRFVKLALAVAVKDELFVQLGPRNYKLSTEERHRMKNGKSRRKSTKASAEKKKVSTKKRSSAKKEGDEKKKSPKKRTTKNSKKEGEEKKKKSPKKRSTSEKETIKSKKRKSVGKVDDDEDAPRIKKAKKASKSEKSSGDDSTLIWVS